MPLLGDIKIVKTNQYIWAACLTCGKERWVQYRVSWKKPKSLRCRACANKIYWGGLTGEKHHRWKGGSHKTPQGYRLTRIYPADFFYPMADSNGFVREHRLVMAKHLKRCLVVWEIVHHKNGAKDDNRIENLELITDKRFHLVDIVTKSYIQRLEQRVTLLESENALLREQALVLSVKEPRAWPDSEAKRIVE